MIKASGHPSFIDTSWHAAGPMIALAAARLKVKPDGEAVILEEKGRGYFSTARISANGRSRLRTQPKRSYASHVGTRQRLGYIVGPQAGNDSITSDLSILLIDR